MFKNLMLVAVAAMAFTACTEENNEVNAVVKKTIINGVATIDNDDTRSGFVGSETKENEDGTTTTFYKSAWDGNETIKLYINYGAAETTATVDAEGKFTAEFEGDFAESCTISACSPAEAWNSEYSFTIPTEQTPRTNSVDPAAHILKAQSITVTNGSASFKMQHEVAYGKMTVNTPAEFVIDHVDIELNGAWYGYDKSLSYTINADNVENNTFWFATDVIEVSEMTVTAYDADDKAYTKTVTMNEGKTLKFQYYKVSTFSVSNLVEYEEPAAPAFTSASADGTYGDRYVTFTSQELGTLILNTYNCFQNSIWPAGTYTFGDTSNHIYPGSYSTYNGTSLYSGQVLVSFVNRQYHVEFFNLADNSGNIVLEHATYTGTISPLQVPDPRQALATPNANATVDGKTITISWEAVDNAEGYRVKLYSPYDEYLETIITDTKYVYEAQQWDTNYSFTIMSYASDENETYKPSEDAYVDAKIGKDPSTLISLSTMSTGASHSYGYGYTFTNDNDTNFTIVFSDWIATSSSINPGTYNVVSSVSYVNQLNVALDASKTYRFEGVSSKLSSGTISVAKDGETYTIEMSLVLSNGTALDYKYVGSLGGSSSEGGETPDPENPGEGGETPDPENPGDGGETPDPENPGDGGETPDPENPGDGGIPEGYIEIAQCIYYGDLMGAGIADEFVLLSADGKNKLFFNFNNATTDPNYIPTGEYTLSRPGATGNTFNMNTTSDTTIINGELYANGVDTNSGSTMSVVSEGKGGVHEIKLTIINNQGTNKFYFKGTIN